MKPPFSSTRDVIVRTNDLAEAVRFYGKVLGFKETSRMPGLVGFETGSFTLYVEEGLPHGPIFELLVADVPAARKHLVSEGCTVVEEDPAVPRCYMRDPRGVTFNLGPRPADAPPLLPAPRDTLAGCIWLPRIIAKARRLQAGTLPEDYVKRFCHATGVDGVFIRYFGLTREDVLKAAALPDEAVAPWFRGLATATDPRVAEWNHIAVNLGRPGFPLAERLPVALETTYKHLKGRGLECVFDMLDADEAPVP